MRRPTRQKVMAHKTCQLPRSTSSARTTPQNRRDMGHQVTYSTRPTWYSKDGSFESLCPWKHGDTPCRRFPSLGQPWVRWAPGSLTSGLIHKVVQVLREHQDPGLHLGQLEVLPPHLPTLEHWLCCLVIAFIHFLMMRNKIHMKVQERPENA